MTMELAVDDIPLGQPLDPAEALEEMVMQWVKHPDQVFVEEEASPQGCTLWIHVAEADRGRVIGTKGTHINTLRNFWAIVGAHRGKRFHVEIAGGGRRQPKARAA